MLVPKGKSARERQEKTHWQFVSLIGDAPARLVWVEDPSEESSDTFAESENLHLMGWDTREGGPRRLVAEPGNFGRPLLTPDGRHVVFTEKRMERREDARQFRPAHPRAGVGDRKNDHASARGYAVDTWAEPRAAASGCTRSKRCRPPGSRASTAARWCDSRSMPRTSRETVWTRTQLSVDSVQVSRDGRRFAALFPWPDAGIGDVGQRSVDQA